MNSEAKVLLIDVIFMWFINLPKAEKLFDFRYSLLPKTIANDKWTNTRTFDTTLHNIEQFVLFYC